MQGFTLIELLLVMVILVVLAAVVVPKFTAATEQARAHRRQDRHHQFRYRARRVRDRQRPLSQLDEGLSALVNAPGDRPALAWPVHQERAELIRGASRTIYQYPGTHNNGFDLYSYGPDGREGNDDIVNWAPTTSFVT